MKLIKLFAFLIFFSKCKSVKYQTKINVNSEITNSLYQEKPIFILSCIRCGCFIDLLKSNNIQLNKTLTNFDIYIDTTCTNKNLFRQKVTHINSEIINKLYEDNYNILLISKKNKSYNSTLIETEGSKKLISILEEYIK